MRSGINRSPRADRDPLDAIDMNELRHRRACQRQSPRTLHSPCTHQITDLAVKLRNVRAGKRLHIGWNRIKHSPGELESRGLNLAAPRNYRAGRSLYLGTPIEHRVDRHVHVIIRNLPPSSNYSARRVVQPRSSPPDLHFLPPRQPEPPLDQPALEHDGDILQVLVPVRGTREPDRHAHHRSGLPVHVHGSDRTRSILILGPKPQLYHVKRSIAQPYLQRVTNGKVVI